ncbi:pentatricopeptide repeat-containing protein 2, mitochondrial isoform X2 [Vanacampus margaritifer]
MIKRGVVVIHLPFVYEGVVSSFVSMALRLFSFSGCRSFLREHISPKATLCALRQSGWIESRLGGNFIELYGHKLQRNSLLLQDELHVLLHLCRSAEDMKTARDAVYRYHAENRNGKYKFGPVFIRLCYELGLEKMAAATLTDKEMRGFFSDFTSFNIGIDMLFVKGYYDDALEVLQFMRRQRVPFNKETLMLASAVCYKLNTTESHAICTSLIEEAQVKGRSVTRHAYCFAVALALKQNDVQRAQALFAQIVSTDRICQNLKILLLVMSGATQEAIVDLSSAVQLSKSPSFFRKPEFSQELLDQMRLRIVGEAQATEAEQVISELERAGQVTRQTLDDMLCHTPTAPKRKMAPIVREKRTSRRIRKPLHSTLTSE